MSVRIPKRLKKRPQFRGLPIPYIAYIDAEGKPDFRVTDEEKRRSVIQNFWCQLCGEPLGKYIFFVGGTGAAEANKYFEPACHLDCLIYAMQVCPFIAGKIEHADTAKVQADHDDMLAARYVTKDGEGLTIKADSTFSTVRNPFWVIKKAQAYKLARSNEGTILLEPHDILKQVQTHPESMTGAQWQKVFDYLSKNTDLQ